MLKPLLFTQASQYIVLSSDPNISGNNRNQLCKKIKHFLLKHFFPKNAFRNQKAVDWCIVYTVQRALCT